MTPTPEPYIYATSIPGAGTPSGQMMRYDYVVNAGDVQTSNLLMFLLFSLWGFFIFVVIAGSALWSRK
jgi:hypothetical protein